LGTSFKVSMLAITSKRQYIVNYNTFTYPMLDTMNQVGNEWEMITTILYCIKLSSGIESV
jgi:hypothetical protein